MKAAAVLSMIAGVALGTGLVAYFGLGQVWTALASVGLGGFSAIILYHLLVFALLGTCWYLLAPEAAGPGAFIWGRLIRDSGSEVLPLSQLGGFVMGARATMIFGVSGTVAIATTIVDITLEMLGQLGYTALGLGILEWERPGEPFAGWTAAGIVLAFFVTIGFILAQQRGFGWAERALQRAASSWVEGAALPFRAVHDHIGAIYGRTAAIVLASLLHLTAWIASSLEAWFALYLMGARLSLAAVILLESLLYAARSVGFAIPNALGVQEGAYVLLGSLIGLSPEAALALSLLKRARDVVIGVPALLAWQTLEGRRLLAVGPGLVQPALKPSRVPVREVEL